MSDWIQGIIRDGSYPGILFLMLLENIFPPIPSELIMPLAGFVSTQGDLGFVGVVVAGTLGAVLGALALYYAGRAVGEERFGRWVERHGHWVGLTPRDLQRTHTWFDRHGAKTVLLCRLVPGIRSLISIPAGFARMPLGRFLAYTTLGSALWTGALASAGRALGNNYEQVERYVGPIGTGVIGVLVLLWLIRIVRHFRQHAAPTR